MIPKDGINLQYLKGALQRRLWYIVVPFFLVSIATVMYCIKAPRTYRSSTTILVQPQEVPSYYVSPTVTSDARSRLNTLKEQVMSRPRLEGIIKQYDLYQKIRTASTMYDAVETMRKFITVSVRGSGVVTRRGSAPAAFDVSYEGQEPAKVRDVTAAIANLFIDDNLKLREAQAAGTSKFLEREVERMKGELRQKEELVRQFKEKYMGKLPEQMENNYRILSQLQQHLDAINESIQKSKDRKVLLQSQLAKIESLGVSAQDQPTNLEGLRRKFESLRLHYSDKHPDVIRLTASIAKIEKEQEATTFDSDSKEQEAGTIEADSEKQQVSAQPGTAQQLMWVQKEDLYTQLEMIDKEIQKLQKNKEKTSKKIQKYQQRIENAPKIENMFVDLRRDYKQASNSYQTLLQKKLQAKLAENLERTQKGEQFVILDPANLPQRPFKPNVRKSLSMGLMLALACGLGLAFLREYLDLSFWSSKDLESVVGLPVLVSIPVVTTNQERRSNRLKRLGAVGAFVSMGSVLIYALFVLWKMDPTAFPILLG